MAGIALAACCLILVWRLPERRRLAGSSEGGGTSVSQVRPDDEARMEPARQPAELARQSASGESSHGSPEQGVPHAPVLTVEQSEAISNRVLVEWQAAINFYGKVVDERSNAVSGADVQFSWTESPSENGNREAKTETGPDGLFSLNGERGAILGVHIGKEGYYSSRQGSDTFHYSVMGRFIADPKSPVVFRLRKMGLVQPLVAMKRNRAIPRDGTPVWFDLTTGNTAPGENGDLVVRCWTQDHGKPRGQRYDWHCTVAVPGGGLVPTDEEFPFLAPEGSYAPAEEIIMPADRPDWKDDVELRFYYRLANGRYGRMKFAMIAGGQHFCMIDSVLNPSGSRNLEGP
jgi:hypothetical protein